MRLIKKILNKCNGLRYSQEYLCFAKESFQQPMHVYLFSNGQVIKDITNEHLFTGYSPLIFTLYSHANLDEELPADIDIVFTHQYLQPNGHFEKKDALAWLSLKLIHQQSAGNIRIVYYKGINGKHHFLSFFHQYILGLNNRLYNKRPGNVFLNNNLYKQVQIAYSLPRIISLVTVSDSNFYNLFPTDLHGPINEQYYIISLRHKGMACRQVEKLLQILISEVDCNTYKTVYSLGKNHMQALKPKESFPFSESSSTLFQLPLPQPALNYRELELIETFEHGIHKILLFKIISRQIIKDKPVTLAHIHNCYATWRHNKGLLGNYLLR